MNDHNLLHLSAWIAYAGCVALVLGNVIGSIVVPGHDPVADTVSALAAGPYEIIQDIALYGFAAGLLALALGAANAHPGGWPWTAAVFGWALLAGLVVVIAARNEYGDGDSEGIVLHIYFVIGLGLLFALVPLAMWPGLRGSDRMLRGALYGAAGLWAIGAPIFFLLPTGFDGLWERGLGVLAIVMVVATARWLQRLA